MAFTAHSFESSTDITITYVVLTDALFIVEWTEGESQARFEASSIDGFHYKGNYGYPKLDRDRHVEFRRFQALGKPHVVMVGRWWKVGGNSAGWVIHLDSLEPRAAGPISMRSAASM